MPTAHTIKNEYPKVAHEARILAMDADGNYTSAEVEYIVEFTDGADKTGQDIDGEHLEEEALVATLAKARGNPIGSLTVKSVAIKERLAPSAFSVTAAYSKNEDESESGTGQGGGGGNDESEPEMSFECSAQSKHVTIANRQGIVWNDGSDPKYANGKDLGNVIEWNQKYGDDYEAKGCDTPTGTATETWTKTIPYSRITTRKKIVWGQLVGCVNKAAWKGWPPRCAMFMGASFSKETGNSKVRVSFHFAVGPDREEVEMGGKKITVLKSPFDYVWPLTDTPSKNGVQVPTTRAIVVSEVAPEGNFNELGI